jgi:hypothetical protein
MIGKSTEIDGSQELKPGLHITYDNKDTKVKGISNKQIINLT